MKKQQDEHFDNPQRFLDITAAEIKDDELNIRRDAAKQQLHSEGKPVVTVSNVYGGSHIRAWKNKDE